jgi:hypothetical protein
MQSDLYSLPNSMELGHSWDARSHSANHKIPIILWNPKVKYLIENSLLLLSIMNQVNALKSFTS